MVTAPVNGFSGYESRALIRNASTNVSLRSTADDRILAWGLDGTLPEKASGLGKLLNADKIAERKYAELSNEAEKMLCGISVTEPEYVYRGTYGITRDGLPLVGIHPDYENVYFDLPAGANSILFAISTGHILTELCRNEELDNPFSPERPTL